MRRGCNQVTGDAKFASTLASSHSAGCLDQLIERMGTITAGFVAQDAERLAQVRQVLVTSETVEIVWAAVRWVDIELLCRGAAARHRSCVSSLKKRAGAPDVRNTKCRRQSHPLHWHGSRHSRKMRRVRAHVQSRYSALPSSRRSLLHRGLGPAHCCR